MEKKDINVTAALAVMKEASDALARAALLLNDDYSERMTILKSVLDTATTQVRVKHAYQ